uniref:Transposase of ISCARN18, IS110 family IS1111 group n=1 Tax=mine drainage metagenome TaxID=410659 RepID=E6PQG1_9ZZZZ
MSAGQIIGTIDGLQVVGLDIAKQVFQMHTVDIATGEIVNVQIKRGKVLEHFANRAQCVIGMEACGGAHHWARELRGLGHAVRLLHAQAVRPFVSGNKTDAADARAIWLAVQQPGTKFVGVKSLAQQATLTLHRQRELLMKMRTMQTHALRGLLYEFGAVFAKGTRVMLGEVEAALQSLCNKLPQMVAESLREQVQRIKALGEDIAAIEKRLALQLRQDEAMRRIAEIPGVGVLTATAAIATMGDAHAFGSAREFCAWLGLVPRQWGTGGKVRLQGISKRGDAYVRTLLIHGARSVLMHAKEPGPWLEQIRARRPANVVIVAQAAKMARTIWAVTARQQPYQKGYRSVRPQAA